MNKVNINKSQLTTRVSISASIFFVICRRVRPSGQTEKFVSLLVSSLHTSRTGVGAACSYSFCICCGRVEAVNSDVLIVRFVL